MFTILGTNFHGIFQATDCSKDNKTNRIEPKHKAALQSSGVKDQRKSKRLVTDIGNYEHFGAMPPPGMPWKSGESFMTGKGGIMIRRYHIAAKRTNANTQPN